MIGFQINWWGWEAGIAFNGVFKPVKKETGPSANWGQAGAAFGLNGTRSFMYTPAIGLSLDNGFDIGVKYDGYKSNAFPNAASLKIGYQFSH